MKKIDYLLQRQRIKQAEKYIAGDSILDIGCHHGELFEIIRRKKQVCGDGIDGVLTRSIQTADYTLYPGYFPQDFPVEKQYDNITLLAVLEHIPIEQLEKYPDLLSKYLKPKGRVIITVPSKYVDYILDVLVFFKFIDGMDLEHHQDFERPVIKKIFTESGYRLIADRRFEFGLNIVYVFEKPE